MGLRSGWKFEYTCAEVGAAAKKRREHHGRRAQWWDGQKDKAEADLRANGVEIREYDQTKSHSNALYADMQLVVDPERQRRYRECCQKVSEHQGTAATYASFERALLSNSERSVKLFVDDIAFFHLHDDEVEGDA